MANKKEFRGEATKITSNDGVGGSSETLLLPDSGGVNERGGVALTNKNSNSNLQYTVRFLTMRLSLKYFYVISKAILLLMVIFLLLWFHIRLTAIEVRLRTYSYYKTNERFEGFSPRESTIRFDGDEIENENGQEFDLGVGIGNGEFNVSVPDNGELRRTKRKVDPQGVNISGKSKVSHHRNTSANVSIKPGSESHVEFINPRLKEEIERGNGVVGPGTGTGSISGSPDSSSAGSGPDGAWLTAYSRIPVAAMQEFCSGVKDYCPPGISGPPGINGIPGKPGPKGERGDAGYIGDTGPRGHTGTPGAPGLRGPRGEPGIPGLSGTDGRDGLPGEPGLDGIPGRNGLDGIPGMEGLRGRDGTHGTPGRNGTDGTSGQQGIQGPPGTPGPRGSTGIAGQKGASGTPGRDGTPGIQAWIFQNGTDRGILIPPAIVGPTTKHPTLVPVKEEDDVRLRCTVTGTPPPTVSWKREDGAPIRLGQWKADSVEGPQLNFTRINRQHMGEYTCVVGNGLTPYAKRSYIVEVHFPPLIHVQNQQVAVVIGANGTLHCDVEAFPEAVTYWESSDEKLLTAGDKYQFSSISFASYKILMTLNITKVAKSDLNFYYCVAKNILGLVKGRLSLSELDPSQATPPPHSVGPHGTGVTYGKQPPNFIDYTDNCPPMPPPCKECPPRLEAQKCTVGGYYLLDKFLWDVTKLDTFSLPTAADRPATAECVLSAVGKPVYHGNKPYEGTWIRETFDGNVPGADKYWLTMAEDPMGILQEFYNKTGFSENKFGRNTTLHPNFHGNYHTIYNGSLFYVAQPSSSDPMERVKIFRQSLTNPTNVAEMILPASSFLAQPLYSSYSTRAAKSLVDLAVDENGLWAIYSLENSNNTAVVKIDIDESERMNITYGWNITISHKHAGDMFIICGILYAVDSVTERSTKIRMALDLYKHNLLKVELQFTNPFENTIMISYNPKTKELFTWDSGNQLIYPVKHAAAGTSGSGPGSEKKGRLMSQELSSPEQGSLNWRRTNNS